MKRVLTVLITLIAFNAGAQQPGEEENGIWYMYFGMNRIAERWSIHTEAQFRYFETKGNFNQMLLRTGMNYHINDNAIATFGYAYIDTDPTFLDNQSTSAPIEMPILTDDLKENRIFQQFILKNKVWEFNFEHRYRLEQRFLENRDLNTTFTEHRARYRLQATLPLTNTFFLNFYDELFINLQNELFGQNRLYGAVGVNITENSNLQLGWLRNQFTNAVFNRFQIAFFYNPDLRGVFKKKARGQ